MIIVMMSQMSYDLSNPTRLDVITKYLNFHGPLFIRIHSDIKSDDRKDKSVMKLMVNP